MDDILTHSPLVLRPDPSRTVIRPFTPGDPPGFEDGAPRPQRITDRILSLDEDQVGRQLSRMSIMLDHRHRGLEALLMRRFEEVTRGMIDCPHVSEVKKLLIGAYFSQEYSFEAAALFNPSMTLRPDRESPPGEVAFAMSLRGIGEGHVSSVTFRTGTWSEANGFAIDPLSPQSVAPRVEAIEGEEDAFRLICDDAQEPTEAVLFPVTPSQKQGIEDVRLVTFTEEDGSVSYLATYTAFSGSAARSELLQATSFKEFITRPMRGVVAEGKGTALFPRRVAGRYAMLGRQDNENIWLLRSDSLSEWHEGAKLVTPRYPWEFVQMGNCGSPMEIDEGWLVLTHGVGVVRNYCIGACLLDKDDPSKVLARTPEPLLRPSPEEQDGYVPNVVYSCGGLVHDRTLLLPYAVADTFTTFAHVPVDAVLARME